MIPTQNVPPLWGAWSYPTQKPPDFLSQIMAHHLTKYCLGHHDVDLKPQKLWNPQNVPSSYIWVFPKIGGKTPQIIPFVHRVWNPYFHHPFWGVFPLFFG